MGIVRYEDLVQAMLPEGRRTPRSPENPTTIGQPANSTARLYCRSNTSSSSSLNSLFNSEGSRLEKVNEVQRTVNSTDAKGIVAYMQGEDHDDRYALWNFQNILGSGTIEFRGGRGIRGLERTRWWVSFVVGFIQFLLTEERRFKVFLPECDTAEDNH